MVEAMDSNDTLRDPEVTGDFKDGAIPIPITGITGTLKFTYDGKKVTIQGEMTNVPKGGHGFHIHSNPFTASQKLVIFTNLGVIFQYFEQNYIGSFSFV